MACLLDYISGSETGRLNIRMLEHRAFSLFLFPFNFQFLANFEFEHGCCVIHMRPSEKETLLSKERRESSSKIIK